MDNTRNSISGKVVVVTGADHGQGLEIARYLSCLGVRLVLAGREGYVLQQVARELERNGGAVHAVHANAADPNDAARLVAAAAGAFGRIDVMVNCPPSTQAVPRADHVTPGAMLVGDSILSAVNGTLAAFEYMHGQGRGHIINVMPLTMPGTIEQRVLDASIKSGMFGLPACPDGVRAQHGIFTTLVVAPPAACALAKAILNDCACNGRISALARSLELAILETLDHQGEQIQLDQSRNAFCPWLTHPQPLRKTA